MCIRSVVQYILCVVVMGYVDNDTSIEYSSPADNICTSVVKCEFVDVYLFAFVYILN